MLRRHSALLFFSVFVTASVVFAEEPPSQPVIQDQMDISLDYTLTVDGQVIDSTEGKVPFHYVQGKHQIVSGLEQALAGLHVGDTKEVVVQPADGYGIVDPAAIVEVSKAKLPVGVTPETGMVLKGVAPSGESFQARIKEVKQESVLLDLNPPLAGKVLHFKVKIQNITPSSA